MATAPAPVPPVHKIMSIPELMHLVMGCVEDIDDLVSACLTSWAFNIAARPYLWRSVSLPKLYIKKRRISGKPFHEARAAELTSYTRHLSVDGSVVAPQTISRITYHHWDHRLIDLSHVELQQELDALFLALQEILMRTPHLLSFTSFRVPRLLDLVVLLHKHCAAIEAIQLSALDHDSEGLLVRPPVDPAESTYHAANSTILPFANVLAQGATGTFPVLAFPNLATLDLAGTAFCGPNSRERTIPQLAALLVASPNLKHLHLSGSVRVRSSDDPSPSFPPPGNRVPALFTKLCRAYKDASGQSLKLRFLKLGGGWEFELDHQVERGHYPITELLDVACLEELHMDYWDMSSNSQFNSMISLVDYLRFHLGEVPRLRKLTLPKLVNYVPQSGVLMWLLLDETYIGFASRLSVKLFNPVSSLKPELLGAGEKSVAVSYRGLQYCVWPGHAHVNSGTADPWTSVFTHLGQTRSLQILAPSLYLYVHMGEGQLSKAAAGFAGMAELRELWLIWIPQAACDDMRAVWAEIANQSFDGCTQAQLQALAMSFAETCPKLSYLRMGHVAWRILRYEPEARHEGIVLQQLTPWEVENKLPDAFDFRTPTLGSGGLFPWIPVHY
ncbi:hypothetical protein B0T22DRAFT_247086 [Podospora appendiculata]|uniref:F-box domain-containing protein n=1 Tax=Podospora appendiculata TaxID=314037 RepID=A0AAE0X2H0_9PEZI|nr:hypothetical protein B0T22DRAFT_247086 [Podospora appendiculata]